MADFQDYVIEYQMRGSDITEQVLNLTQEEKEHIWDALLINYRPENRVYRYNFFFDNCATRPAAILERRSTGASIISIPINPRPSGILLIIVPETIRGSHSDAT